MILGFTDKVVVKLSASALTSSTALWRKLVSKFTMGRLLSRIAASHSTGSNRRSSHVYPYFTQLRALMYLFRSVRAPTLQAAASAHPQHGRCPPGLRGRQDVSGFAAPVCRRPRCLQYGRLSPHQPLGGRLRAHNPTRRAAPCFSQQKRAGAPNLGSLTPAVAHRLDGLCPVRQLVRLGQIDQLCPSPEMACDLRPQVQSHAQWGTHRPSCFRSQAPAVYTRARDRHGWEHHDLLCAADHRSSQRCSPRCPCVVFKTAPPGEILGVLYEYGPHSLGSTGLAGLRRAAVMREGHNLPLNPTWTGGASRAILH